MNEIVVALASFVVGLALSLPMVFRVSVKWHRRFDISSEVALSYEGLMATEGDEAGEFGARTRALAITCEFERSLADPSSGYLELEIRLALRRPPWGRGG